MLDNETLQQPSPFEVVDSFTSTDAIMDKKVDLEHITQICSGLRAEFINSFMGLPIKVDVSLSGKDYYIAVSPELLEEIKSNNA